MKHLFGWFPRFGPGPSASSTDHPTSGFTKLNLKDTLVLKGIAIGAIALHNYYHVLGPVKENEFEFDPARYIVFLHSIQDPRQTLQALFSFLGHYGVQIFIFLSAYGLARRHWETPRRWSDFMWSRAKKIYPTFFLAILAWALYMGLGGVNPLGIIGQNFGMLTLTVLGVQNIVPGVDLPPIGPWWFFPFIMQFYALWPSLRLIVKRYDIQGLLVLSGSSIALLYIANDVLVARWWINLLETPIGHMPEICLGIFVGRYGVFPGKAAGLIGGAILVGGNIHRALWPLSFVGALLLMVWLYQIVGQRLRRWTFLEQLGICSGALFFVNGFVRMPFVAMAQQRTWVYGLLLGFASTAVAILVARLLYRVEGRLRGAKHGDGAPPEPRPASRAG